MRRLRGLIVLAWIASSLIALGWSLIPPKAAAGCITLKPIDLAQAEPTLGAGTASASPRPSWTPTLLLEKVLPTRLRLGTGEQVRLILAITESGSNPLRLMAAARLHAVGADVEPTGDVTLPLAGAVPVHFDWTVAARERGPIWLALSLRLRAITDEGTVIGEQLVWALSQALPSQGWLGLPAPLARWGGLTSALIGALAAYWMTREGRL